MQHPVGCNCCNFLSDIPKFHHEHSNHPPNSDVNFANIWGMPNEIRLMVNKEIDYFILFFPNTPGWFFWQLNPLEYSRLFGEFGCQKMKSKNWQFDPTSSRLVHFGAQVWICGFNGSSDWTLNHYTTISFPKAQVASIQTGDFGWLKSLKNTCHVANLNSLSTRLDGW
jgi:hypothetical protein